MKTKKIFFVITLILGCILLLRFKWYLEEPQKMSSQEVVGKLLQNEETAKSILLDSAVIRLQSKLIKDDSLMTVYLLNQLEFRPKIAKLMLYNLHRHYIIDKSALDQGILKIEQNRLVENL